MSRDKGAVQKTPLPVIMEPLDGMRRIDYTALTRMDWIIAPVAAAIAAIILYFNIYSAINWDDLQYMSQAQFTFPDPVILNRYAHIYILKIFYFLTGSPITGTRVFWCFMFFGTSVL